MRRRIQCYGCRIEIGSVEFVCFVTTMHSYFVYLSANHGLRVRFNCLGRQFAVYGVQGAHQREGEDALRTLRAQGGRNLCRKIARGERVP